jgi:alpha-mannosidase
MPITVHMIAQAHLDPVWLWRWTEGRAEALATSQSALDRLAEYPDLHFTRGEAQVYQWIEDENLAMFRLIQQMVSQGRWHIVNGMIIQPDLNLPQGESLVRQALLGKRYFAEKFGQEVSIAYCVDSFGHAGTLPQILKQCGFEHYVFMRPQEHEKQLPGQAFWWQSPDGTRLLAFRISRSYASWGDDPTESISVALADRPDSLEDVACFFGVGNHGGGPTRRQIERLVQFNAQREDIDLRFSSLQAYFDSIQPHTGDLPVVADELQYHAVGCYSVNSRLKRLHRQAECALLQAERMAALARLWAGQPPDRALLRSLWHDLCFNQFHDILAGTCIKEAQDESEMALSRVVLSARELIDRSGRLVGENVDTSGPGGALLVFNPFPYPFRGCLEYEPWTGGERWRASSWGLVDDGNSPVPHQVIEAQPATGRSETRGFDRLLFQADLSPLGYRLYRYDRGLPVQQPLAGAQAHDNALENEFLRIRLDLETGSIVSCFDKASGLELVGRSGWNVAQVIHDPSDTWSHAVRSYDQVLGRFSQARIRPADSGPLQASLLVERSWQDETGASGTWLQQVILRSGASEIILRNELYWHGAWRTLKLAFDLPLSQPQGVRDVPFGALPFPTDGLETPMQQWAAVFGALSSGEAGLAVLNDGKYACDLLGSTLRLTILRSPPYGYHVPHEIGAKQHYDWIDQGSQRFDLVLRPFIGDWKKAEIVRRARELNLPPVLVTMHSHPGKLPPSQGLCSLESQELELTALKPLEDGEGYLLRLADRHGAGGEGILTWMGQPFTVVCKPYEVRAFRIERLEDAWDLFPCDFLERPYRSHDV